MLIGENIVQSVHTWIEKIYGRRFTRFAERTSTRSVDLEISFRVGISIDREREREGERGGGEDRCPKGAEGTCADI